MFKVGDVVVAVQNAPYPLTTNGWEGRVVHIPLPGAMQVVSTIYAAGPVFFVAQRHFRLANAVDDDANFPQPCDGMNSWVESKLPPTEPEVNNNPCICDFYTVILASGCQCGGV